ncbi:MAG: valine--tRNA ligase [Gammaproteobacteria bacterium]|nr:valine--tRNA ligase [Gammaproteobacteria bacterium]
MEGSFNPGAIEQALYAQWESSGAFSPQGNGSGYCIVIPPPNVTGSLHMGHAFNQTLMDTLIRFQRMRGKRTLWQMGTDHAGIATQMLVERKLQTKGIGRHDLGREAFIDKVWEWKAESGGTISRQIRRMGSSLDWTRDRFTMDEGFSRAVIEVFVRLHEEGLIYRGQRLVNWDPQLESAISDLEVDNQEEQGHLWHFRYPLTNGRTADGRDFIVVATTRPETMLGDTAVAVHPDDARYRDLIGKTVRLPLVGREIPVIADTYVDPAFGSGCVKITPAHDFNDYAVGQRHGLPMINIFTADAHINDNAPHAYRGLTREAGRKVVVAAFEAAGLLERIDNHKLMVPRGDRSGAIIEPYLTSQWFVKMEPLATPAIEVVERGEIEFIPKLFENTYFAWMRNIQDWCISRQQWWGHRIPAWYDAAGNIYVGRTEADARQKHGLAGDVVLTADPDVLETWFSSALWTFGTMGWPDDTPELRLFHPTDVLVTAHDIIFFWVARMIMMTLHFTGEIPFRKVYVHGLVRDAVGNKMSKTKGNGLDPLDFIDGIDLEALVEKRTSNLTQPQMAARIAKSTRDEFPQGIEAYGTDAVRFTFCAVATLGRDVRFDVKRIEGYRNFCNKLWNAAKFVLSNTEGFDPKAKGTPSLADRWIVSRTRQMLEANTLAIETYRFDLLAASLYDFAWHEYCDWYLEITKPLLWNSATPRSELNAIKGALLNVLEVLLRAAHPIIPFITETIWQDVRERLDLPAGSVMIQQYPEAADYAADSDADAAIEWLKGVVLGIRNIRGEANIKPSLAVSLLLQGGDGRDRTLAQQCEPLVKRLAKVETIEWLEPATTAPVNALALVGSLKVMVPLAGLIDLGAEKERLRKEVARLEGEINRINGKLSNQKFVANAPADVVAKEREKAADAQAKIDALRTQLDLLG